MDEAPKSAVELAMARLRQKDSQEGIAERSLSEVQKAEIGSVRQAYAAKLAQEEILFKSRVQSLFEPEERRRVEDGYRRDVLRLNEERDRKIEKIRQG